MLINSFRAAPERRSTTPDSVIKFPNIKAPISGVASGSNSKQSPKTTNGNMIRSPRRTVRNCLISSFRSVSVVSRFMIGG